MTARFAKLNSATPWPSDVVIVVQMRTVTLKSGPFRHLRGEWRFRALDPNASKVEFELAYEFATPLLERIVGPVFNHIANTFVDAFVRRAESVYGSRQ